MRQGVDDDRVLMMTGCYDDEVCIDHISSGLRCAALAADDSICGLYFAIFHSLAHFFLQVPMSRVAKIISTYTKILAGDAPYIRS